MRIGIKPRVDVVFKKVFASAEHSDITRDFLNSLLPLAGLPRIVRLTILNPFRLADFQGDKEIVVDVHAEDENRREFQIEMQLKRDSGLPSRVMDNLSRLYGSQVGKGKPYGGHRQTIAIWILEHRFFGDANWLHVFRFRDDTSGEILSEELIAITVELPKREVLPGSGALGTFETGIDEWLWFLEHGEEIDPAESRYQGLRSELQEAVTIMEAFSKQDKARYTYDRRLEWERLQLGMKEEARAEGVAEGKAEGLAEATRDVAKKMLALGIPAETIVAATGVPKEELSAL